MSEGVPKPMSEEDLRIRNAEISPETQRQESVVERFHDSFESPGVEKGVSDSASDIAARDSERLEAVRARLNLPNDQGVRGIEVQTQQELAEDLLSDPTFLEMRKTKHAEDRDKPDDLIEYEVEQEFKREFPDRFNEYQTLEEKRIYQDQQGNPSLEDDQVYKRTFLPRNRGGFGYSSEVSSDEMNARRHIVDNYPEKAAAYARTDDILRRMLENRNR